MEVEILFWITRSAAKGNLHGAQRNAKKITTYSGKQLLKKQTLPIGMSFERPACKSTEFKPYKKLRVNNLHIDQNKLFLRSIKQIVTQ
ncbi:hypothetical protein [Flavobacterium caeni]|uniref:hypothetical protein n=1 Tax=Flavobacterium caeni TaxID=490189 RepID=UPI000B8783D9|nr:hypothetical protein [Flavobacterium caeni]